MACKYTRNPPEQIGRWQLLHARVAWAAVVSRIRRLSDFRGDLLLAAAVSALLVVELSVENVHGPWEVNLGFGLVMTGALAWRRWPLAMVHDGPTASRRRS